FITRLRRRGREGWQRLGRRLLPTPGNVLFTLLMIGLLLWAQSAGALPLRLLGPNVPSTNTIAYQGRLADANGSPLTGTYSIIFRLYNVASGGAPLWEEQWTGQNGVQVSDGLFNVMLGSLTPIPQAVVTGNNTLWLGITVGTDDEMAPRVQLGSVPFAVQALTVPDGSVTTGKIADQAVTQAKLGDGAVTTGKIADQAVTSQKQTAAATYVEDNSYLVAQGQGPLVVSEFNFSNVPAGDIVIMCSFVAGIPSGANPYAAIHLSVSPGGELSRMPGHIMSAQLDQYVLHGRLSNFGGGSLAILMMYTGEQPTTQIGFGSGNGDSRFGRKCTVTFGI
ncbi:MAG: hypothetical protein WBR35_06240, partial [Anaerolineae bacterium]